MQKFRSQSHLGVRGYVAVNSLIHEGQASTSTVSTPRVWASNSGFRLGDCTQSRRPIRKRRRARSMPLQPLAKATIGLLSLAALYFCDDSNHRPP